MLRSEREWFPIFLELCELYREYLHNYPNTATRDGLQFTRDSWKRYYMATYILPEVLQCDSFRKISAMVQGIGIDHKHNLLGLVTDARLAVDIPGYHKHRALRRIKNGILVRDWYEESLLNYTVKT